MIYLASTFKWLKKGDKLTDAKTDLQERREFFRLKFETPVQFKSYSTVKNQKGNAPLEKGLSQNISQSGILFQTNDTPPQLSSILWMRVDIRTLKICQEIERRAIIFKDGLLGRVVRVEEDAKQQNIYDVGVCFLTQDQRDLRKENQILTESKPG